MSINQTTRDQLLDRYTTAFLDYTECCRTLGAKKSAMGLDRLPENDPDVVAMRNAKNKQSYEHSLYAAVLQGRGMYQPKVVAEADMTRNDRVALAYRKQLYDLHFQYDAFCIQISDLGGKPRKYGPIMTARNHRVHELCNDRQDVQTAILKLQALLNVYDDGGDIVLAKLAMDDDADAC